MTNSRNRKIHETPQECNYDIPSLHPSLLLGSSFP
uniref:Uncharacterized protein n=1 Tax=Arundo donax TaxID=35708 RepID=A0A0A9T020_ARUDO